LDDPDDKLHLSPDQIRRLCHRQTGIGADGILIRTRSSRADHSLLLFNADGSSAEISGNGLRCFVLFLRERGYPVDEEVRIETGGGVQHARLIGENMVETTMPAPTFSPATGGKHKGGNGEKGRMETLELSVKDQTFSVLPVTVGNPHGVIFGPERDIAFAEKYGHDLEKHPAFPQGANIEFVHVIDNRSCKLVVWERGAGITLACGSGSVATACAGAAVGHFLFDTPISIHQPGGTLEITVGKNFSEIRQRGPATFVFKGEIEI
jgi:diaminopimelate epimerase